MDADAARIGDVALGFGYGLRVGILRDEGPLPGRVGERDAAEHPADRVRRPRQGDEFRYAVDLQATNLRLVASKQFAALQLAAGIGWDRYTGDAEIQLRDRSAGGRRSIGRI